MHNLPAPLLAALEEDFDCRLPLLKQQTGGGDGTVKLLVGLADAADVETVVIPREERRTLCLSSQAGCAMGCRFCATAALGLKRNLEAGEMVAQVLMGRQAALPLPLTGYVFMGMGEPLANYDRLLRALAIMTAKWGLGISARRITVSTVGLVPQLERLAAETSVNIAVSLTAVRDDLRGRLMPINGRYPLCELMAACRRLELPKRKRITFEYVMLKGVNDSPADADGLVSLMRGLRVKVNLIPFNPFDGCEFSRSGDADVAAFQDRLLRADIHASIRASRGSDIQAACGQLAAGAA
jgi:23S rRNA (adenine2503-C2)-methyltransferase